MNNQSFDIIIKIILKLQCPIKVSYIKREKE